VTTQLQLINIIIIIIIINNVATGKEQFLVSDFLFLCYLALVSNSVGRVTCDLLIGWVQQLAVFESVSILQM
jgi:hypothetical protein